MAVFKFSVVCLVTTIVSSSIIDKRATGQVCHNSYTCTGSATCCRDVNDNLVTDQQMGPFGPQIGRHQSGICSNTLGKSGAICDSKCGCQSGFACYRRMSGVCCPPMRCYNATWVQQQKEYWNKCMHDPHCALPP